MRRSKLRKRMAVIGVLATAELPLSMADIMRRSGVLTGSLVPILDQLEDTGSIAAHLEWLDEFEHPERPPRLLYYWVGDLSNAT